MPVRDMVQAMRTSLRCAIIGWLGLFASTAVAQTPTTQPTTRPALRILVDSIHAHNFLQDENARAYEYHQAYGHRTFFNFVRKFAAVEEIKEGRITAERLKGVSALFINLVSPDLPPFYVDEILAIREFIQQGGGLFVIVEHSSCYFSAQKIGPLLDALDIRNYNETACDDAPQRLAQSPGWLAISHFKPHPVTRDVGWYAMQTGGTIDDRFAIATLSENGWGDLWTMQAFGETPIGLGHYGNWTRDAGERAGALGVCVAKEIGQGKVFILADQNMMGDPWLQFAGNYRMALNGMGWLCNDMDRINGKAYYDSFDRHALFYEPFGNFNFGDLAVNGCSNLFMALSRHGAVFAFDDLKMAYDTLVFLDDHPKLSAEQEKIVADRLKKGLVVLVLQNPPGAEGELVKHLSKTLGDATEELQPGYSRFRWKDATGEVRCFNNLAVSNNAISAPDKPPTFEQRNTIQVLENHFKSAMQK